MDLSRRALINTAVVGVGAWSALGAISLARAATGVAYDGAGIYLYPGWGEPRPYLVLPALGRAHSVEFRDPVLQTLLWTLSLSLCGDFAGKMTSL
jgi:hypothetical protein